MDYKVVLDQITLMLMKVENDECLCLVSMNEIFFNLISLYENLELELLSISTFRKIAEAYLNNVVSTSFTCGKMYEFIQLFHADDVWHKTIIYFKRKEDRFLLYEIAKFLAITMYTFPCDIFMRRLHMLLADLYQNANKEYCAYDLEFLSCIVCLDVGKCRDKNISKCKNTTNCTICPLEDIFNVTCLAIAQNWKSLLDVFLRAYNQNICLFLNLWKNICERNLKGDFLLTILNEELAVEFLSLSLKMPSESFQMFVDIISQDDIV